MISKKINIKAFFAIIIVPSVIGIIFNILSDKGISMIKTEDKVTFVNISDLNSDSTFTEIKAIDTKTVKELFDLRKALFIDARDKWEHSDGHIPGSLNIAEYKFDEDKSKLIDVDKGRLIIIYCGGDDCDLSKRVYKKMYELGYQNIYVYLDGYSIWSENNFPIQKEEL